MSGSLVAMSTSSPKRHPVHMQHNQHPRTAVVDFAESANDGLQLRGHKSDRNAAETSSGSKHLSAQAESPQPSVSSPSGSSESSATFSAQGAPRMDDGDHSTSNQCQFPPPPNSVDHATLTAALSHGDACHVNTSSSEPGASFMPSMPKLDRTMTDIYADELYHPNFTITATLPTPRQGASPARSGSDVLSQRIQAANNHNAGSFQHSIASHSNNYVIPSPPTTTVELSGSSPSQAATGEQSLQSRVKAGRKRAGVMSMPRLGLLDPGVDHGLLSPLGNSSSTCISPSDALLEAPLSPDIALFPQACAGSLSRLHAPIPSTIITRSGPENDATREASLSDHTDITGIQSPEPSDSDDVENQQSSPGSGTVSSRKPGSTLTGKGTFSCTYQGCPHRFETAAQLQKHKRENHRQPHVPIPSGHDPIVVSPVNTQHGPHKCTQLNPSTGKPCNIEFSRPYDLTRHEDTIHNPQKRKVTCPACTDQKQFSRGDALSRHYRVCHPDLTPPGKKRGSGGRV